MTEQTIDNRRARVFSAALGLGLTSAFVLSASADAAGPTPARPDARRRIVAVGDVHGDHARLLTVLQAAKVVDARGRWIGGSTHLVQTGDRIDRGPDSRKVMDFFIGLEKPARKAGGAVHALVGNHEAMNVHGDLRYVIPAEFAAFRTPDSARLRDALFERDREERAAKGLPALGDADRARWDSDHPLGWIEHRLAYSPRGRYGGWIAGLEAVLKLGDTLFVHGGVSPKYADFPLDVLNDRVRQELREADRLTAVVTTDPDGPLWFRGFAEGDPALAPALDAVLARHGCRRMVVGHTVTEGLVMPRYGGKLVGIDVGLSAAYGGPPAALVLEDGKAFALHRGKLLELPEEGGAPLVRYVRKAAALEPDPAKLQELARRLEAEVTATRP